MTHGRRSDSEKTNTPTGRFRVFLRSSRLMSTSIFSNFFWSILNLGLTKGLRLVAITLCVRQMGTTSWGEVAATIALLTLIGLVVSQGLSGLPQIFRVNEREMDRPLLFNITLYRLLTALVVILGMRALAPYLPTLSPLVLLYSLILIPRALSIDWLFHRRERYHLAVAIGSVRAVVFFGLVFWKIGPESTAQSVILMEITAEFTALLLNLMLLRRAGLSGSPRGGRLALGTMLLAAFPVFLSEILHVLPVTVDVLFLKSLWGYQAVAEYDIGARIGMAYFFLGASLVQIVIPKLSRLYADGQIKAMGRVLSVTSDVLLVLGAVLLLPSFYFAPEVIGLLFGKEYSSTVFVFQWMPVWVYVSFMTMLNTIVLLASGRRKRYFYGALLSTAVNVIANWALITHFSVAGAVVARIVSEAVFCVYAVLALPREIKSSYVGELWVQSGLLAAILAIYGATIRVSPVSGFVLSILVCGAVFWRRRVFSTDTLKTLRSN